MMHKLYMTLYGKSNELCGRSFELINISQDTININTFNYLIIKYPRHKIDSSAVNIISHDSN